MQCKQPSNEKYLRSGIYNCSFKHKTHPVCWTPEECARRGVRPQPAVKPCMRALQQNCWLCIEWSVCPQLISNNNNKRFIHLEYLGGFGYCSDCDCACACGGVARLSGYAHQQSTLNDSVSFPALKAKFHTESFAARTCSVLSWDQRRPPVA